MSFRIALSGLAASQASLDVTANNISNANTNGFKQSRAEFTDVYATAFGSIGSISTGAGVRLAAVSALGRLGHPDGAKALAAATGDGNAEVAETAFQVLCARPAAAGRAPTDPTRHSGRWARRRSGLRSTPAESPPRSGPSLRRSLR